MIKITKLKKDGYWVTITSKMGTTFTDREEEGLVEYVIHNVSPKEVSKEVKLSEKQMKEMVINSFEDVILPLLPKSAIKKAYEGLKEKDEVNIDKKGNKGNKVEKTDEISEKAKEDVTETKEEKVTKKVTKEEKVKKVTEKVTEKKDKKVTEKKDKKEEEDIDLSLLTR